MTNELIMQDSWWKRNRKWFLPVSGLALVSIGILLFSGMGSNAMDITKAYADSELYDTALEKVKSDKRVKDLLGDIEPIDKLAILEGYVEYGKDNKTVSSSIRIIGSKEKAKMDISAERIENKWNYTKINVRIKDKEKVSQTIEILTKDYRKKDLD